MNTKNTIGAICVLGMHRSGTSCITGLLEDAGVYLGNVSKHNPHNKKGNQENLRIVSLHDEVLGDNGGSWDNPPLATRWSRTQKAALQQLVAGYPQSGRWAFKDPRTLFTLSAWQELLPNLDYLGTFRHPGAVAQSLYRRGGMPPEQAYALWSRYNTRLLQYRQDLGFDILCFDLDPVHYLESARRAFGRLGLDVSRTELGFFDARLRSVTLDESFTDPPAEVMALYQHLKEIAG